MKCPKCGYPYAAPPKCPSCGAEITEEMEIAAGTPVKAATVVARPRERRRSRPKEAAEVTVEETEEE